MMVYSPMATSTTKGNNSVDNNLLSQHIGNWGERKNDGGAGEGWSQVSYDSSELEKFASPFDDIGFLAGGPSPDLDPPPKREQPKTKKEEIRPKQRSIPKRRLIKQNSLVTGTGNTIEEKKESNKEKPSLGRFLEDTTTEAPSDPVENRSVHSRGSLSRRLDKTISTRDMFKDDEASLALSTALGKKVSSNEKDTSTKGKTGRNPFDFSRTSMGLSGLNASKVNDMDDSKASFGNSKNSFFTARTSQQNSKAFDSSTRSNRSTQSSAFGSTRSSTEAPKKKPSKFSIMMRKEKKGKGLDEYKEKVASLETTNDDLFNENRLLHAKLEEMASAVEKQKQMEGWMSIEQIAAITTEMWQYQSLALLADVHMNKMEAKIHSYDKLIAAKERSINNLELVRNQQEKRIGYLEMQCLQNGIEISEEGDRPVIRLEEEEPLKGSFTEINVEDELSNCSFADDAPVQKRPIPFNVAYSPARIDAFSRLGHMSRGSKGSKGSKTSRKKERDHLEESERSEGNLSMAMSELSARSITDVDESPSKSGSQQSLAASITRKIPAGAPLGDFLVGTSEPKEHCIETGTWDPTKALDFFDGGSPLDTGATETPPGPPSSHGHSCPAPSNRKGIVMSTSTRSKSPGTRRRLKGTKPRSKSPGTRRKAKETTTESTTDAGSQLRRNNVSSNTISSLNARRKLKGTKSNESLRGFRISGNTKDSLDRGGSTHSLSRASNHRRRMRNAKEKFDRETVSSALEKALGASVNALESMDDDFLKNNMKPLEKPKTTIVAQTASRRKIQRDIKHDVDNDDDDEGLDLLDAVFQD